MTKAGRKATATLMAASVMMQVGRVAAQDEPIAANEPTIVLHFVNYAALSREVLGEAKARIASVYEIIGVRTVWVDSERPIEKRQDGRLHLTVLLLSREMAQQKISADRLTEHVLGQAHLPCGRAYIFCNWIATGSLTSSSVPLGDVITHEVGHLALQSNSHSRSGIMRAEIDVHAIRLQSFNKTQTRTISTTLMALTAAAPER